MPNFRVRRYRQLLTPSLTLALAGCAASSAISPGYDLSRVRKIGVVKAQSECQELHGIEGLLTQHLVGFDFKVVERTDLSQVLQEQKLAASGAVSPEGVKRLGQILGVDALAIVQVSSCLPERKQVVMIRTRTRHEESVIAKSPE